MSHTTPFSGGCSALGGRSAALTIVPEVAKVGTATTRVSCPPGPVPRTPTVSFSETQVNLRVFVHFSPFPGVPRPKEQPFTVRHMRAFEQARLEGRLVSREIHVRRFRKEERIAIEERVARCAPGGSGNVRSVMLASVQERVKTTSERAGSKMHQQGSKAATTQNSGGCPAGARKAHRVCRAPTVPCAPSGSSPP